MNNKKTYSASLPTLIIDLNKIRNNYKSFVNFVGNARVAAMVKANAYGLGANEVTKALIKEKCNNFFVANIDEAIALRKKIKEESVNIYVLTGIFKDDAEYFYHYKLIPVLNYLEQINIWHNIAIKYQTTLRAILHLNTGMYRLGMPIDEFNLLLQNKSLLANIKLDFIMSHLTSSEVSDSSCNNEQLSLFKKLIANFPKTKASLVNSAGVLLGSEFHFDLVRVGAGLYGINEPNNKISCNNPILLVAPIIQIQKLGQNTAIGYNGTYCTKKSSIIVTIALGYADGISRALSNKGYLFIDNHRAPIVGRISMDLLMIDVTDVPSENIFLGQMVEIIGPNITPNKLASYSDTVGYEMITLLSSRYHRIYKN